MPAQPKRPRTPRVSRLDLPPGVIEAALDKLQQRDVLLRIALCVVAATIMWALTGAGSRPFPYRLNDVPARNIVARYEFSRIDQAKTDQAKAAARSQARSVYNNDPELLVNVREELKNKIVALTQSTVLADEKVQALWREFMPAGKAPPVATPVAPAEPAAAPSTPAPMTPASVNPAPSTTEAMPPAASGESVETPPAAQAKPAPMPPPAKQDPPATLVATEVSAARQADTPAANVEAPPADNAVEPATPKAQPAASEPPADKTATPSATDKPPTEPPAPPAEKSPDEPEKTAEKTPATAPAKPPEKPVKKPPLTPDQALFEQFRAALLPQGNLDRFKAAVDEAFMPLLKHGLIDVLPQTHDGNQREIRVRTGEDDGSVFQVSEVLKGDILPDLEQSLANLLQSKLVAQITFDWIKTRLPNTLTPNPTATQEAQARAAAAVKDVVIPYRPGDLLAKADEPIDAETHKLLVREHNSENAQPSLADRLTRSAAVFGMFLAMFSLCGFYIAFREPRLVANLARFTLLMSMATLAVLLSYAVASELRAEIIPLIIFGMTMAIAYQQELAMLLSAAVAMTVVFLLGFGLTSFVVLTATVSVAVLLLGRIRSRRKLIYVGLTAAGVSMLTSLGVNTLAGPSVSLATLQAATWCGLWTLVAAFLMTGLLPFIENLFGVQTDLSLIELGDVAHPLLQELVRRAPGTYNHSIMVASIGEAAAEAIGAHGLLVRVGAYFHDIGKMLKPGYFIENQGMSGNRHEDLVPAMSTLIIIAHVKDGADLARQHHLPQPIIDFIQQHHGTTLVEYFYGRAAAEQRSQNPDRPVDESSFRYPGPKPQTKEAAVLMLADAVESASRSLVEPAPARIESLVEEIAMKRLLDGQFDSCGLTLQELHTIEDSLVKSLIAVYHGRVKYPDQRTA